MPLNKEMMVPWDRLVSFEISMMPMKHSSRNAQKAIEKMAKDRDLSLHDRDTG